MKDIRNHIDNDKGMVLFSVLALIVALTAASVVLVNMTTHELDVSANKKCLGQAFFAAESGMRGMMKVLDRSVEEAELVDPTDLQFQAYDREGDLADAKDDYEDVFFNEKGADVNATKLEKFTHTEMANIAPSEMDVAYPLHTYAQLPAEIDADVNFYRTHNATLQGNTLEFASGYEGHKGNMAIFFRIISQGHGCINSNFTVNGEYRYVSR